MRSLAKEATWAERLAVVNAMTLKNEIEGLKGELEAVSRQMLEEEKMGAGKEDVKEIQGRMMLSRLVEHCMDEEMIDEDNDTLQIKPRKKTLLCYYILIIDQVKTNTT